MPCLDYSRLPSSGEARKGDAFPGRLPGVGESVLRTGLTRGSDPQRSRPYADLEISRTPPPLYPTTTSGPNLVSHAENRAAPNPCSCPPPHLAVRLPPGHIPVASRGHPPPPLRGTAPPDLADGRMVSSAMGWLASPFVPDADNGVGEAPPDSSALPTSYTAGRSLADTCIHVSHTRFRASPPTCAPCSPHHDGGIFSSLLARV